MPPPTRKNPISKNDYSDYTSDSSTNTSVSTGTTTGVETTTTNTIPWKNAKTKQVKGNDKIYQKFQQNQQKLKQLKIQKEIPNQSDHRNPIIKENINPSSAKNEDCSKFYVRVNDIDPNVGLFLMPKETKKALDHKKNTKESNQTKQESLNTQYEYQHDVNMISPMGLYYQHLEKIQLNSPYIQRYEYNVDRTSPYGTLPVWPLNATHNQVNYYSNRLVQSYGTVPVQQYNMFQQQQQQQLVNPSSINNVNQFNVNRYSQQNESKINNRNEPNSPRSTTRNRLATLDRDIKQIIAIEKEQKEKYKKLEQNFEKMKKLFERTTLRERPIDDKIGTSNSYDMAEIKMNSKFEDISCSVNEVRSRHLKSPHELARKIVQIDKMITDFLEEFDKNQ